MYVLTLKGGELMFKKSQSVLIAVSCCLTVMAQTVIAENATDVLEVVYKARIVINEKQSTGFIIAPICKNDGCVDTRLTITPETIASENGRAVPLKRAKSRIGRDVGIEYEISTNKVVNISW